MGQIFEHCNMPGTHFDDANLARSIFTRVNLAGTTFHDVNLDGVTISNANLQDVKIDDANVAGLTIFGIDVSKLIDDEMDRRDPERARLRVHDFYDPADVRRVMARVEPLRASFRAQLSSIADVTLATRPSPNEWSVIEIVRHLLFTEELYLNRLILQNDRPFSRLGQLPEHMQAGRPGYETVGTEVCSDLATVWAAWDAAHAETLFYLANLTPEVLKRPAKTPEGHPRAAGERLQVVAMHVLGHIRQAEQVLAALGL